MRPGSLRQERRQVRFVEDANQVRHVALQGRGQTKDSQKVWELDSNLHCTDVRLGNAYPLGKPLLTQTTFQSQFPKARAEQLAECRFVF
jgi:hypothetical protein